MDLLAIRPIICPWCGSPIEVAVDLSAGAQELIEDCLVCCAPMLVRVVCDPLTNALVDVTAVRDNE